MPDSIFALYYADEAFVDRFLQRPEGAIDIIIPVLNTNKLWEKNLISFYREIPVNRLIIGNGGCNDDTVAIAKRFPRVEVWLPHIPRPLRRIRRYHELARSGFKAMARHALEYLLTSLADLSNPIRKGIYSAH
jgi:hypothetical protein